MEQENTPDSKRWQKPPAVHFGRQMFNDVEPLVNPEEGEKTRFNDLGRFLFYFFREYLFNEPLPFDPRKKGDKLLLLVRRQIQEKLDYNEAQWNARQTARSEGGRNSANVPKNEGNSNAVKEFEVGNTEEERNALTFLDKLRAVFARVDRGGLAGKGAFLFILNRELWKEEAEILARAEKWVNCKKWNALGSKGKRLAPSVRQWLESGDYLREPDGRENPVEAKPLTVETLRQERSQKIAQIAQQRKIPLSEAELFAMLFDAKNALPNGNLSQLQRWIRSEFEREGRGISEAKKLTYACIALTDQLEEEQKSERLREQELEQLGFNITAAAEAENVPRERAELRIYFNEANNSFYYDLPFAVAREEILEQIVFRRQYLTQCSTEEAKAFAERCLSEPLNVADLQEIEKAEQERQKREAERKLKAQEELRLANEAEERRKAQEEERDANRKKAEEEKALERERKEAEFNAYTFDKINDSTEKERLLEEELADPNSEEHRKRVAFEFKMEFAPILGIKPASIMHSSPEALAGFSRTTMQQHASTFLEKCREFAKSEAWQKRRETVRPLEPIMVGELLKLLLNPAHAETTPETVSNNAEAQPETSDGISAILEAFNSKGVKAFANKRSQTTFKKNALGEQLETLLPQVNDFLNTEEGKQLNGKRFDVSRFFEWITETVKQ